MQLLPGIPEYKMQRGQQINITDPNLGFGYTESETKPSPWLRHTEINIRPGNYCHKKILERGGTEFFSKDQSICGVGNGGKDACEGDSGGPLVVNVEVRDSHTVHSLTIMVIGRSLMDPTIFCQVRGSQRQENTLW